MKVEYRITFDYDTRKGEIAMFQDDLEIGDVEAIKHIHIAQSRTVDYEKDEHGKVISMKKIGPTMTTFTMTGADDAE